VRLAVAIIMFRVFQTVWSLCGRFFSETPEEEENHGAATEAA